MLLEVETYTRLLQGLARTAGKQQQQRTAVEFVHRGEK